MDFKVLLIQANSPFDTLIPPNIATLSACLKKEKIKVKLFDTTFYKTRDITGDDARVETLQVKKTSFSKHGIHFNKTDMIEDFQKMVKEYDPDLIGVSAVSLTYPVGLKLLKSISGIPTIVGGVHATVCVCDVLKEKSVDMVCVGEGEEALVEVCQRLQKGDDVSNVRNIWTKSKEGLFLPQPVRPPVDISKLPFQDWEIFEERRRYKPMGGKIRICAGIEKTRGCPFRCGYCLNKYFHNMYENRWYREKEIKSFIAEVKYLSKRYNIEYIYICSESFLVTKKAVFDEFIKEYAKIQIPFWIETRPESVTSKKIRRLKQVGCESINIGIESGDPTMRKNLLNRNMTNQQIIDAVHIIKKEGIRIGVNNIIGFPTETRTQIFKTISLTREANPDNVMIHPFNPYHGTELHQFCLENNLISEDTLGGDYRSDFLLNMPQITNEELKGLHRTFNLYVKFPKEMWPEIIKAEKFDNGGNEVFKNLSKIYRRKYLV